MLLTEFNSIFQSNGKFVTETPHNDDQESESKHTTETQKIVMKCILQEKEKMSHAENQNKQ